MMSMVVASLNKKNIQQRLIQSHLRIDASSIRVYELPKNTWFEIGTESNAYALIWFRMLRAVSTTAWQLENPNKSLQTFYNMIEFRKKSLKPKHVREMLTSHNTKTSPDNFVYFYHIQLSEV